MAHGENRGLWIRRSVVRNNLSVIGFSVKVNFNILVNFSLVNKKKEVVGKNNDVEQKMLSSLTPA